MSSPPPQVNHLRKLGICLNKPSHLYQSHENLWFVESFSLPQIPQQAIDPLILQSAGDHIAANLLGLLDGTALYRCR